MTPISGKISSLFLAVVEIVQVEAFDEVFERAKAFQLGRIKHARLARRLGRFGCTLVFIEDNAGTVQHGLFDENRRLDAHREGDCIRGT